MLHIDPRVDDCYTQHKISFPGDFSLPGGGQSSPTLLISREGICGETQVEVMESWWKSMEFFNFRVLHFVWKINVAYLEESGVSKERMIEVT